MFTGVVVIGRNEGERLKKCIGAFINTNIHAVYVDSGSTDGSVEWARTMPIDVVCLDMRMPFTAARARNEGFRRLRELAPDITCVQFVDGDCELSRNWLDKAAEFLACSDDVAVVCGRLREKFPKRTIYNMLCDMEWDAPAGEAKACGGIAMMRVKAFEDVIGYRSDLIAGEEPELCVRLRAAGWRVWRLSDEMGLHDAAILQFGQWWKRTLRGGYAFAQGEALHGSSPERHCVRESRRIWLWGMGIPVSILFLVLWQGPWALAFLIIYPMQIIRLVLNDNTSGRPLRERWWHAVFLVIGNIPELFGQLKFLLHRNLGEPARLIEYK